MKSLKFCLILIFLFAQIAANSQTPDTTSLKILVAKTDAKKIRLNKQEIKDLRKQKYNPKSDYFKPNFKYTNDTLLLSDSVYNQAFREAALKKVLRKEYLPVIPTVIVIAGTALLTYVIIVILFVLP